MIKVSGANKYLSYVWHVLDDSLIPIAPYTSVGTIDVDNSAQLPSEPLEEGKFMSYNVVFEPARVNLTLFFNGDYSIQVLALAMLDAFMRNGRTCTIFSPTWIWRNMALSHYSYSRSNNNGATLLAVDCAFQEVRAITVEESYTTDSTKKSTSVSKVNTGQVTTTNLPDSILDKSIS